ncbi:MAG: redoxin domain-containing protein [Thermoanaerobacteraceae bacterium]|nr:redoxin domain-containing protein [Thermoanaerobacteraceae bacterium]
MNKKVVSVTILAVVIICVLGALLWSARGEKPANTPGAGAPRAGGEEQKSGQTGTEVGQVAPDFSLGTPEGKTVSLASLRGKPVMLNFWATWCPPCREEMPAVQQFFTTRGQEIQVVAVNLTSSERTPGEVPRFLKDGGYTFPVLLDVKGDVAKQYLIRYIPTTFFIDAQGVIRYVHTGPMNREIMQEGLSLAKGS